MRRNGALLESTNECLALLNGSSVTWVSFKYAVN